MTTLLAKQLASEPVSKVELSVRCHSLIDKDLTSKSDPICVLQMADKTNLFIEVGRTEQIKNDLNPVFARSFSVDFFFEETQQLRFLLYDIDNASYTLDDDDFLGSVDCTLAEVVSSSPFTRPLMLKGNKQAGKSTLTVTATELSKQNEILLLHFRAKDLDNKDFFSKSDPFLEFHVPTKDDSYRLVYRTEVVDNNLNPTWKSFEIKSSKLCFADHTDVIKVMCYDSDDNGSHDFIGSFETSVQELKEAKNHMIEWPCINPKKKAKKRDYKNSGVVVLQGCTTTKEFSFLDFVFGGLHINFTVGIDFTASNGDPSGHNSLHSLQPLQNNQYIKAIQSVGSVIQHYDSDRMFPALGYGACIPPDMTVSHCFPLSFNQANPFCPGIQAVLDAYASCLRSIRLYGPTNFAPIIYHVAQFASQSKALGTPNNYFVLLIITDGVISDMDETVKAIIHSSTLPLSIIIVGVGNADFKSMDFLDSDTGLLKDRWGHQASRDIVQFVPFNQFSTLDHAALAKQVLAEVPSQVVSYFRMVNLQPLKPSPDKPLQTQQGPLYNPHQPFVPQQQSHLQQQPQQFQQQPQQFQQQPQQFQQQPQQFQQQPQQFQQQPQQFQQQPQQFQQQPQQFQQQPQQFQQQPQQFQQQFQQQQPLGNGNQYHQSDKAHHQQPLPQQQLPTGVYQTAQTVYPSLPSLPNQSLNPQIASSQFPNNSQYPGQQYQK